MKLFVQNSPIFIFAMLIFSGCHFMFNLPEQETFQLILPDWPPKDSFMEQYPELLQWEITTATSNSITEGYTTEQSVFLSFNKNTPSCVLIQPVTKLADGNPSNFFKPAGFLYPYSTINKGAAKADWNQGFLAYSMLTVINSQKETGVSEARMEKFLASFNWKKAQETIDSKFTSSLESECVYNPWLIDSQKMLENLCYGNFKATFLNLTGCCQFTLSELTDGKLPVVLSAFVPENMYLESKAQIYLKKEQEVILSDGKQYAVKLHCKSAKNLSRELIYMPIYCKRL